MERSFLKLIKSALLLVVIGSQLLAVPATTAGKDKELVLVTLNSSPIESITARDIRRVYLGVSMQINAVTVEPIRNTSDSLLYQMFLQKVVYLSARDYERQLISRTFRKGGSRPAEMDEAKDIVERLRENPGAVSFMWADAVANYPELKVVKSLWKGSLN